MSMRVSATTPTTLTASTAPITGRRSERSLRRRLLVMGALLGFATAIEYGLGAAASHDQAVLASDGTAIGHNMASTNGDGTAVGMGRY